LRKRKDPAAGLDMNLTGNETLVCVACAIAALCLACLWLAGKAARRANGQAAAAQPAADCASQIAERTRELSEFAQYLQRVREREKRKFARSLHDELGSLLISAKMDIENVSCLLARQAQPELVARLQRAQEALEQAVIAKRRIVEEMYPTLLDNLGLAAAMEWEISETCRHAGLEFALELPEDMDLPGNVSITLFRVVQEALTNAVRHAAAANVIVTIAIADSNISLLVEDDGVGIADTAHSDGGIHGVAEMRQRVRSLGGELAIRKRPAPQAGTMVEANIPYPETPALPAAN
jgi:signal transduction histidine kinase